MCIDIVSQDDFDVDNFVADCRHRVQLETLREDLHIYFKSLKNAMVELINKGAAWPGPGVLVLLVQENTRLLGENKAGRLQLKAGRLQLENARQGI